MAHTWLPSGTAVLAATVRKPTWAHSNRESGCQWLQQSLWKSAGLDGQRAVPQTKMKTPSDLHGATKVRSSRKFRRSRAWPCWKYLVGRPWTSPLRDIDVQQEWHWSKEGGGPEWPPPQLPHSCRTKAIHQPFKSPNLLAQDHQMEGRTFFKEQLRPRHSSKSQDFPLRHIQDYLLMCPHHHKDTPAPTAAFSPLSGLSFCFVNRILKIEYNKFHAWQLTAAKDGAPEMHLFIYWGWGGRW